VIVAPDQGRRLAAAWPAATLRETRGLGHRNLLRDPATLEAVAAFFQAR
jgi:hypothetical protein